MNDNYVKRIMSKWNRIRSIKGSTCYWWSHVSVVFGVCAYVGVSWTRKGSKKTL